MTQTTQSNVSSASRGSIWLSALVPQGKADGSFPPSVRVVDGVLGGEPARYIAVVPDANNPFPRARQGEVGLLEGWALARAVREPIEADETAVARRPIVAIIDVVSQAYGRREEAYGIHQALAGAAAAYADARLAGHPVIGLIVGKAMSGGLLAHGYQANRLLALDDPQVMVHAMGKAAAARITMRSVAQLEALAATIAPMAYDISNYATLGLLWRLLRVRQADQPTAGDVDEVRNSLEQALQDIRRDETRGLTGRLDQPARRMSREVRQRLQATWEEG